MKIISKNTRIISSALGAFLLSSSVSAMNNNLAQNPLANPAKANLSVVGNISVENGQKVYNVDYMNGGTNVSMVVDPIETPNVSFEDIDLNFSNAVQITVKDNPNILQFGLFNLEDEMAKIDFFRAGADVENFTANCDVVLQVNCRKRMSFNNVSVRSDQYKAAFWSKTAVTVHNFTADGDTVSIGNFGKFDVRQGNIDCRDFIFFAPGRNSNFAGFHVDCDEFSILNRSEVTVNGTALCNFKMACSGGQRFTDLFSNFQRKPDGALTAEFTEAGPYNISQLEGDISLISFPNAAGAVAVGHLDPRCPVRIFM